MRLHLLASTCLFAVVLSTAGYAEPAETILANSNRTAAGILRNGVLNVSLEARVGLWRPQADDGPGVEVQAFGEVGKPLQVPGPLLRVRSQTRIRITVRNTLVAPLVVYGFYARPGRTEDTLRIAAGATRTVEFTAGEPGTYYYWGTTTDSPMDVRDGDDSQLSGAIIIDPAAGAIPQDRIMIMGLWLQPEVKTGPNAHPEREILVINGKSWPHTERFTFTVGDTVRWRVLNPTTSSHPMHLHGFYFEADRRGDWAISRIIPAAERRLLVTQLLLPGETMDMRWVPAREGNWVFHCHFAFHVSTDLYLAPQPGGHEGHAAGSSKPHAMAGLVIGISVKPNPAMLAVKANAEARAIRLIAQQRTDTASPMPPFGYALSVSGSEPSPDSVSASGPVLVLKRGEPVAITVVNRTKEQTAVHWHGIELESFPDGIPGWSGTPARIMPPIEPQDSFVAEFVPPRAGTFIYHSHSNELGQILGGLVGPLIVLPAGHELPANDRIFMVSASANSPAAFGLINGERALAPMNLVADETYRFRFINIGDWRVFFSLLDERGFVRVRMIAKDGADLPAAVEAPLNLLSGPGETADFEVKLPRGTYRLEFKQQLAGWISPVELRVR